MRVPTDDVLPLLGNRLSSYGGVLRYTILQRVEATAATATRVQDVPLHYSDVILEVGVLSRRAL